MDTRPQPIHCIEKDRAEELIGKEILWAQDKEGLGYYGTLMGFDEKTGQFRVKAPIGNHTYKCSWIVEYKL